MVISNEVIITAIGAATTIITAFLGYLIQKLELVHRVVNSTASALALQVAADKAVAEEKAKVEKLLAISVEKDKAVALAETEIRVIAAKDQKKEVKHGSE